jgi:hypothetical protein
VFHGVEVDLMEQVAGQDKEVNTNFLEHNIKKLLKSVWGIQCTAAFTHAYRSATVFFFYYFKVVHRQDFLNHFLKAVFQNGAIIQRLD